MKTELLYMKEMERIKCSAKVVSCYQDGDKKVIVLNQTVFYPQGGGQPYDTGVITSLDGTSVFQVEAVHFHEGQVRHIGKTERGEISEGMEVKCLVDEERRRLNTRLHSAGHLIDMALKEMQVSWTPNKGYHFPQGAYVEYHTDTSEIDLEGTRQTLEVRCNEIISKGVETKIVFNNNKLQKGKPMRTVYYGNFGIPCGGTHVSNLKEIGPMSIRKIKRKKGVVRVSYSV